MPGAEIARGDVSVVLDGPPTPRWQQRALAGLRARGLDVREVRLVSGPRSGRLRSAHAAFERRLFAAGPDAMAAEEVAPVRSAHATDESALVIWLAEGSAPEMHRATLALRHDGRFESAEQAFRRAVLRGSPWVQTDAVLLREGDAQVIDTTVSGARPYSVTLSRDKALWKIAEMVGRVTERALLVGAHADHGPPDPDGAMRERNTAGVASAGDSGTGAGAPARRRAPSTLELIVRSSWRWLRIVVGRALYDRPWQVRVRVRQADPTAGWDAAAAAGVNWRAGHLYADPFLFEHEGRHHLFCEEIPSGSDRAVISHVELTQNAPAVAPEPVLAEPHHLSYPFVFEHEGEVFLIPETSAQRRVTLYRASDFPLRWEQEAVLLDGLTASDATLLAHDGRLWLFVGVAAEHATMLDELHLFSAASLTGEWRAHPRNPIVSDVRGARPAGAIQHWGSALVRPAQDCGRRYGGAVSFRQIDVLSDDDYAEHEIARLEPAAVGPLARATHTYASDGSFEATDLRERSLRSPAEALRIARRLARLARRAR